MDIITTVRNLQQKSVSARRRILVCSVGISMVLVVGFWLMAISRNINSISSHSSTGTASAGSVMNESPFDVFKETAGESWEELQRLFK
ncbi:MAG: hypothetical protein AAB710_01815 [Patescibacteria group bacterium]